MEEYIAEICDKTLNKVSYLWEDDISHIAFEKSSKNLIKSIEIPLSMNSIQSTKNNEKSSDLFIFNPDSSSIQGKYTH